MDLFLLLPLYGVAAGFALLWWDLRRRELRLKETHPDPEVAEKFAVEKLGVLASEVTELKLGLNGILDTVHAELEDARSERRKAVAAKAGASPRVASPSTEAPAFEQMDRPTQLAAIEARYRH